MTVVEQVKHLRHVVGDRVIAVRTVAWALVAVALFDGGGLTFGGPKVSSGPSYAVLEQIPGGMRSWGVLLLAGAAAVSWGIGHDTYGGHPRALNLMLSVGVFYYLTWAVCIPLAWWRLGVLPAWGAESKQLLLAFLYYVSARAVAVPRAKGPHRAI